MRIATRLLCMTAATALTLLSGSPAWADDTEVFFGTTTSAASNDPNILLVLDTSGSMTSTITSTVPYNSATPYAGSCDPTRVYFRKSSSSAIDCSTSNWVPLTTFQCSAAITAFTGVGYFQDAGIRWRRRNSNPLTYAWSATFSTGSFTYTDYITCLSNSGPSYYPLSGSDLSTGNRYNGTSATNYWSTGGTQTQYFFYSANYLNYLGTGPTSTLSRLQIVKNAANSLIDSVTSVNIGVMRYDSHGSGGMVIQPVQPVATGAAALKASINGMFACGDTPLSETLYEAYQYYKGGPVGFGNNSKAAIADALSASCSGEVNSRSVAASRVGSPATTSSPNYKSPIVASCQKNHIVYLTDGLANNDTSADAAIDALAGTTCYASQTAMWAALGVPEPTDTHSGGLCLKPLAKYMNDNDMSSTLTDIQNVNTHFIGFGDDVAGGAAEMYLRDAARAGGGDAYTAGNYAELTTVLEKIVAGIKDDSASFASPSVAVNAFNKTQVLEDMYIAMFKPSITTHWPGNVKKFKLRSSQVVGRGASLSTVDTVSAVDPTTGFFTNSSKDFWQQLTDSNTENTTKGGAANMIPDPASRTVYTYIGTNTPSTPQLLSGHPFTTSNTSITNSLLAIGAAGDPAHDVLINWARGDDDGNLTTTGDTRHEMGDPIHSQPAVVIYGTTGATVTDQINDALVFTATNDGYLHAIDVVTGTEQWAFIPQELLNDLKVLYADAPSATKHYSLDGDLRVLKYDVNGNGKVEPADGDRVFLYFSQGRGGPNYYALDVTAKNSPKFLFSLNSSAMGGIVAKSWSTPTLGRVKVGTGSTQNAQRLVLIFGGGYDDLEDSTAYNAADSFGNGLFMVDAVKGTVLWSQTKTTDSSSAFYRMDHAIPSNVTALDTDGDGWTDRMYVGDMAGQVWRFDITNGNSGSYATGVETTAKLVTGGVIASLGGKATGATAADNRSFYNSPDVAKIVSRGSSSYYNIAIGSGDRGLPRTNNSVSDRFYSIRDYRLNPVTQATYNGIVPIIDGDPTTIAGASATTFAAGAVGWKLPLGTGEKALAQSLTVDGVVLFTTYLPPTSSSSTTSCRPPTGSARSYALKIADAQQRFTSLYESFNTTGLPTQISIVNEGQVVRTDGTTAPPPSTTTTPPSTTCMSGVVILGQCVNFGRKVKTFWQESGAN